MQCHLWMSPGNTLYNYRSGQVPLQVASASGQCIYFRTVSYQFLFSFGTFKAITMKNPSLGPYILSKNSDKHLKNRVPSL